MSRRRRKALPDPMTTIIIEVRNASEREVASEGNLLPAGDKQKTTSADGPTGNRSREP
jgi:hypothetical protein